MTTIINADCLNALREMPDNSIDAICTDPPYGLSNTSPDKVTETIIRWASGDREYVPQGKGFMGAAWDGFVPPPAVWDECFRVLKPGGHMAVFAGTRTMDLMTLGIRLAGFDIRDSLAWLYGSGFPKSQDVSKAIDKAAGAKRDVIGKKAVTRILPNNVPFGEGLISGQHGNPVVAGEVDITAPATDAAKQWSGWGTALKPAFEPIILARKPFPGTVAANVVEWGTGAINVDATRIGWQDPAERDLIQKRSGQRTKSGGWGFTPEVEDREKTHEAGRFPANVTLDREAADMLDQQADVSKFFHVADNLDDLDAPFRYCAKAPKKERPRYEDADGQTIQHPTTKPLSLMKWLCKLLVPPGGTVLDPFAGSGTTVEAAILEGFNPVGIEAHKPYIPLIHQRVARAEAGQAALNIA